MVKGLAVYTADGIIVHFDHTVDGLLNESGPSTDYQESLQNSYEIARSCVCELEKDTGKARA